MSSNINMSSNILNLKVNTADEKYSPTDKADQNQTPLPCITLDNEPCITLVNEVNEQINQSIAAGESNRLASKINSLEKIIENLNESHSQSLLGLHSEIERLSTLVSELMFQLATEGIYVYF